MLGEAQERGQARLLVMFTIGARQLQAMSTESGKQNPPLFPDMSLESVATCQFLPVGPLNKRD